VKFPKLLNLRSDADQITLLRRFMGTGFAQVPPAFMMKTIAEKSEKNMQKQVKMALKKGEAVTAEDLIAELKRRPDFMKFCEELGMNLKFFEGMAEKVIKEGGA
jgi:hypothetical protein